VQYWWIRRQSGCPDKQGEVCPWTPPWAGTGNSRGSSRIDVHSGYCDLLIKLGAPAGVQHFLPSPAKIMEGVRGCPSFPIHHRPKTFFRQTVDFLIPVYKPLSQLQPYRRISPENHLRDVIATICAKRESTLEKRLNCAKPAGWPNPATSAFSVSFYSNDKPSDEEVIERIQHGDPMLYLSLRSFYRLVLKVLLRSFAIRAAEDSDAGCFF